RGIRSRDGMCPSSREDGTGGRRHRDLVLVERRELLARSRRREERRRLARMLLRDDVRRRELGGDVAEVNDRSGLRGPSLVAWVDERFVREIDVERLLVIADAGVLAPENRLRDEDVLRLDHALRERDKLGMQGKVVQRVADER